MAYGTNAPFGLQPRQYLTSSTYNGQLSEYLINPTYITSIFSGDPIMMLNDGTIGLWSAGNSCAGTFWGCKYIANVPNSQGNATFTPYWPGNQVIAPNTFVTALIIDDPTVLYDMQVSNSNPGSTTAATIQLGARQQDLNQNANAALGGNAFTDAIAPQNPASGSTISGQSGFYLDASTISATPNLLLKLIRLTPNPKNVFYTAPGNQGIGNGNQGAFNNVIVAINNDVFKGGTGTGGGQVIVANGFLTAAAINAMGGVPVQIIAAPGPGLAVVVNSFVLSASVLHNNTAFTNGGVSGLQYGATASLGGTVITSTQPATIFTTQGSIGPFTYSGVPVAPAANTAVTISNTVADFTTGTLDYQFTVTYSIVPA